MRALLPASTDNTTNSIFYRKHKPPSESQNYFEMPTQKNSKTCYGDYSCSTGTQHGNLHQLSVTTSRVTYFIRRAHTGTGVSNSQHGKNSREIFFINAVEWIERLEISKEEIVDGRRGMHGYVRTCSRLKRESLWAMGFNRGIFDFCVRSTPLDITRAEKYHWLLCVWRRRFDNSPQAKWTHKSRAK